MPRKDRPRAASGQFSELPYNPTAAEIEKACEEIRAGWQPHEWARARRRYGASVPKPAYRFSEMSEGE